MDKRTALRSLLTAVGRNQQWLADTTGIQKADISRMANRGMHPTQDEALLIADAFRSAIAELWSSGTNGELADAA